MWLKARTVQCELLFQVELRCGNSLNNFLKTNKENVLSNVRRIKPIYYTEYQICSSSSNKAGFLDGILAEILILERLNS